MFARTDWLRGTITVPGDKSISHRALMFASLAVGTSRIEGLLEGEDVLATAAALRAMGATIERDGDGSWRVDGVGVGGLLQPDQALDMGNSGTSTRLLMGLVASSPVTATFIGDASLSRRPMKRVIDPLAQMGADISASPGGTLPLMVRGLCPAIPIDYRLPVASAQVKSAVLLAGLNTPGITRVIEPVPTRDHSERMLAGFGAKLTVDQTPEGRVISIEGEAELAPQNIVVPGDPSSAAFFMVAASIVPGSDIVIANVGMNPTRTGLITALPQSVAAVEANIRTLGFAPRDVKLILSTEPHYDHAGGLAALARDTGATVVASVPAAVALRQGHSDADDPQFGQLPALPAVTGKLRAVRDGEAIRLGGVTVVAQATPGHTAGSMSWRWRSCEAKRCLNIVFASSLNPVSVESYRFSDPAHAAWVASFRRTIARVGKMPCDILFTAHPENSGGETKFAQFERQLVPNPFIEAGACYDLAVRYTKILDDRLASEVAPAR